MKSVEPSSRDFFIKSLKNPKKRRIVSGRILESRTKMALASQRERTENQTVAALTRRKKRQLMRKPGHEEAVDVVGDSQTASVEVFGESGTEGSHGSDELREVEGGEVGGL